MKPQDTCKLVLTIILIIVIIYGVMFSGILPPGDQDKPPGYTLLQFGGRF